MLTTTPQCQPQWYQIPRFHYHLFYFSLQGLTNSKCILNKLSIMRFVHILQLPFSQLASCWPARVSLFTSCYYSLAFLRLLRQKGLPCLSEHFFLTWLFPWALTFPYVFVLTLTSVWPKFFLLYSMRSHVPIHTHTYAHTNGQSNSMDLLSALWPSRL